MPRHVDHWTVLRELWPVLEKPARAAPEGRKALHGVRLERRDRKERTETDHRTHAHGEALARRSAHDVVVEAVRVVPEAHVRPGDMVHRVRDEQEVLEELVRDI